MSLTHSQHEDLIFVEGAPGLPLLAKADDINDVIGECFGLQARSALLYAENMPPAFFDVSSQQAGVILQKLRNYGIQLAVVAAPGSVSFSSRFAELAAAERRDHAFAIFDNRDEAIAWLSA